MVTKAEAMAIVDILEDLMGRIELEPLERYEVMRRLNSEIEIEGDLVFGIERTEVKYNFSVDVA